MPTKVVNLGAEVAIGFIPNIDCSDANTWTTAFWDAMLNGATVKEAAEEACTKSTISINNTTICGNENYKLVIH